MKAAVTLLITTLTGYAQSAVEPPKYEVASIKPNTDGDSHLAFRIEPSGPLAATGITLKRLMMTAYNVQGFRIVGGPDWVASRRWNVEARPDRAAAPNQIRPMLRALLEDRFQLRSHSEERQLPVYELSVDRKGSKVQAAKDSETEGAVRVGAGLIQLTKNTAATFASQLSYALGRPVIDKTGLSGEFDFELEWTPEPGEDGGPTTSGLPPGASDQPASTPNGPSIFTAVREQLGFRLKSARGPVEVIVIDDVRVPTAN
ncbi:MAG: TIGR03435 family protein [Acidobacteriia bacterium]|nr:TIGR03435 family protein [Terriglobia bacterium]